ncbi:MAG: transglycosylase SLT domain-containing protein [Bacteroidota bacterium]
MSTSLTLASVPQVKGKSISIDPQKKIRLQKAVRDFEALFVNQMLQAMRKGVPKSGLFDDEDSSDTQGKDIMETMFDMEISRTLSQSKGIGIANVLYRQITGDELPSAPMRSVQQNILPPENIQVAPKKAELESEFKPVQPVSRVLPGEAKTLRERVDEFDEVITDAAKKYSLDENLIKAVIAAESRGNTAAQSPKNAKGIMQLIDSTATEMGVTNIWDPRENIFGGAKYLRTMLDKFDGDVPLAVASYNAGPGAVKKHNGIPPYKETQKYVQRVLNFMNYFEHPDE